MSYQEMSEDEVITSYLGKVYHDKNLLMNKAIA